MELGELIKPIRIIQVIGTCETEIKAVNIDSRQVETGDLFMAMKGTQTDGHAYISTAIEKGAVAILCEVLPETLSDKITYIQVVDSEDAVGKVATRFFGDPTSKLKLVGVTGTNGKTTIATLLYNTFRYFGYKTGLISTVCNYIDDEAIPTEHTTPDPITLNKLLGRMADEGCKYAFMEVSSHSIDQKRISGLTFAGGIFTNLTRDHLDYHKTVENYLKAKKKFFDDMPKNAFSLTNVDDKNGLVMTQNTKSQVHTYSLRSLSDFKGRVIESHFEGMLLDFNNKELAVQFTSALIGAAIATVITMTATASTYGEKIATLEKLVAAKAEAGAVVELATKADVRELGNMLRSKLEVQDRRDSAQDDRIARVEAVAAESERVLRRVENKLDVLIAIADPDGRVGRTVGRTSGRD